MLRGDSRLDSFGFFIELLRLWPRFEHCDRFNVSRMREHIHDASRTNVPAAFMLQNCAVTCKRSRIAGNVDHAGRTFSVAANTRASAKGAFARRIDQHAVDAAHGLPELFPVLFAPRKRFRARKVVFSANPFSAAP